MATVSSRILDAHALVKGGQYDRALPLIRIAVQKEPNHPEANHILAYALFKTGQHEQAVYYFERAVRLAPKEATVRNNFGSLLFWMHRVEQAMEQFRAAIALDENHYAAYVNMMMALNHGNAIIPACEFGLGAVARFPEGLELVGTVVTALMLGGRIDECIATIRAARERVGPSWYLQTILMLPLNYSHTIAPEEVFEEHRELGRLITAAFPPDPRAHTNTPDPGRALRIGYVSQDFRNRSAAHFIEPILTHHDRARYRAYCYYSGSDTDEMTERLRGCVAGWADVAEASERALAEKIRADQIDIMVDLTGHTGGNRLPALAYLPAPVQVTYMGYPNTTGLEAVGYRVVDAATDPPGSEHLATETLVRISPCFLCYAPPPHAPEVAPVPSLRGGPVTFGSFNTQAKLSPPCVDAWSRTLHAVPGSRLLLKNLVLGDPTVAQRTRELFGAHGVGPERLDLRGETKSKSDHMAMYAEIDVALDSFPYHGTTTTMEAMWMGVPVVALEGNTHVSRVGVSLMNTLGLGELVARTPDEYVRIAAALGTDGPRLSELRSSLRERIRTSPLCDAPAFTRKLESAYRDMWRAWCEGRGGRGG